MESSPEIKNLEPITNNPSNKIRIERLCNPDHAAIVAEWLWNEWDWAYRAVDSIKTESSLAENLMEKTVWVAFDGGELVGTIGLEEKDMEDRPSLKPWLTSLYVPPSHRNKGYGRKLLKHASNHHPMYGSNDMPHLGTVPMHHLPSRLRMSR